MKTLRFFAPILFLQLFIAPAFAQSNLSGLMTPRDILNNNPFSNISLQNNRGSTATIYGTYVRQYAYVTPGQSCDSAIIIYPASNNITAGAFVMPITIKAGQQAALGSNYLYNMIYQTIYYENIIIPSSPPGCALPGCTWGSDVTKYNWCIYLGALAPVSTSAGYTANVPPSADAPSSSGVYNYNVVSSYNYIGPISCDDRTLTCAAATQQTQSFS